jgi:hypothetical protein
MDQNAWVRSQNVERFLHLLKTETDETERARIMKLLAEERRKQKNSRDICTK